MNNLENDLQIREVTDELTGTKNLYRGSESHGEKVFEEDYVESTPVDLGGDNGLKVSFADGTINYVSLSTGKTAFKAPVEIAGEPIQIAGKEYDRISLTDGIGLYDRASGKYLFEEPILSLKETEAYGQKQLAVRFSGKRSNMVSLETGQIQFPQPVKGISAKPVKLGGEEYDQVSFGSTENLYSRKTGRPVAPEPYKGGSLESFFTNRFLQYTELSGAKNIVDLAGKPMFKEGYQGSEPCRRYGAEYLRIFFADGTQNFIGEDGRFLHTRFDDNIEFRSSEPIRFGTEKVVGVDGAETSVAREWDLVAYPDGKQNLLDIRTGRPFFEDNKAHIFAKVFTIAGKEYIGYERPANGIVLMSPTREKYNNIGRISAIEGPVAICSTAFYDITYMNGTRDLINVATGEGLFAGKGYISIRQTETGFLVMDSAGNDIAIPFQTMGLSPEERPAFDLDALRIARGASSEREGAAPESDSKFTEWASTLRLDQLQAVLKPYAAIPEALGIPQADREVLASLFSSKEAGSDAETLREVYSLLSGPSRSLIYANANIRRSTAPNGTEAFVSLHPDDWFASLGEEQKDLALRMHFSAPGQDTEDRDNALFTQFLEDARISRTEETDMDSLFRSLSLDARTSMRETFAQERSARFSRALTNCDAASLRSLVDYAESRGLPVRRPARMTQDAAMSACIDAFVLRPDARFFAKAEEYARSLAGNGIIPDLVCEPFRELYAPGKDINVDTASVTPSGPYVKKTEDGRFMLCSSTGADLLAAPLDEIVPAAESGLGVSASAFVAKSDDGRYFLMNGSGLRMGGYYDAKWEMQTAGRLAMEVERILGGNAPTGAVTVVEDADERRRMVRRREGIDTTKGRYANPFLPGTKVAGKLINTERDAAYAYVAWLSGADYTDFRQGQRSEVLDEILLCRLAGRKVLTDTAAPKDGSYGEGVTEFSVQHPSHATFLNHFITNPESLLSRIQAAQQAKRELDAAIGKVQAPEVDATGHDDSEPASADGDSAAIDMSPEGKWFAGLTFEQRKMVLDKTVLPAGMGKDETVLQTLSEDLNRAPSEPVSRTDALLIKAFYSLSQDARRIVRTQGLFNIRNESVDRGSGFDVYVAGFSMKETKREDVIKTLATPGFDKSQPVVVLNTRKWKSAPNPAVSSAGLRSICKELGYEFEDVNGLDIGSELKAEGFKQLKSSPDFAAFCSTVQSYKDKGYKVILADTFPMPGFTFTSTAACQQLERDGFSVAHILSGGKIQNHDYCMSRFIRKQAASGRMRDIDFEYYGQKKGILPIVPSSVQLVSLENKRETILEGTPTAGFPVGIVISDKSSRSEVRKVLADDSDIIFVFSHLNHAGIKSVSYTEGGEGNVVSAEAQRLDRYGSKSDRKTGTFRDSYVLTEAKREGKVVELSFPDDPSMIDDWKEKTVERMRRALTKKLERQYEKGIYYAADGLLNGREDVIPEDTFDIKVTILGSDIAAIGNAEKVVVSTDETTGQMYNQVVITPTGFEQSRIDNIFADVFEQVFPKGQFESVRPQDVSANNPDISSDDPERDASNPSNKPLRGRITVQTSGESGIELAAGIACQANEVPANVTLPKDCSITLDNGTLRGESSANSKLKISMAGRRALATNHYNLGDTIQLDILDRRKARAFAEETAKTLTDEQESARLRDISIGLPDKMIVYLSSRIPNIDVHRLVRLAQGEPIMVDDKTPEGEDISYPVTPDPEGYVIQSPADLAAFLEDMRREGAIGPASMITEDEIREGLENTDKHMSLLESQGVHLITIRSPYYADVLRNRTLEESETRPVLGIDINTNGSGVSYDEASAEDIRAAWAAAKEAGKTIEEWRAEHVAEASVAKEDIQKPVQSDSVQQVQEADVRISRSGRKHHKIRTGGTPLSFSSAEIKGFASASLVDSQITEELYMAPPAVIPFCGDPSNLNKPMAFIDGSALSGGNVELTPETRIRCKRVGRQLAERGVTVAADMTDPFAMEVAAGASAAGGRCVYSTDAAPDDPSVADFAKHAPEHGDTVLFNSLVAEDGEKGQDTLDKIARRAADKDNSIYFRRGESPLRAGVPSFFGTMASQLSSGPDALIVFALAAKGLQVTTAAAAAVIDIFSPALDESVSIKADELWKKSAAGLAKEIEDKRKEAVLEREMREQELHPETYQFRVLRRGTEQVFVVPKNLPDVQAAIRRTYGESTRFASTAQEAQTLLQTATVDGTTVPVGRNDFNPGVTQVYDEPVYDEWLVYHDETVSAVHLAPDSVTNLRPRAERLANRKLLDRARKHARSIITEFNASLGLPEAMNVQFANAMYLKETPSGVQVYQGASMVGAITMDANGSLRIYSSSPLSYDLDEHHKHFDPVFPKTNLGFSKRSKNNDKGINAEKMEEQISISESEMDKMFTSLRNRVLGFSDVEVSKTALMDRDERADYERSISEGFVTVSSSNNDTAKKDLDEALSSDFSLSPTGAFMCEKELQRIDAELEAGKSEYQQALAKAKELPSVIGSLSDSNSKKKELAKELTTASGIINRYEALAEKRQSAETALEKARADSFAARRQAVLFLDDRIGKRNAQLETLEKRRDAQQLRIAELERSVHEARSDSDGSLDAKLTRISASLEQEHNGLSELEASILDVKEKNAADRVLQERIATASMIEPLSPSETLAMKEKVSGRASTAKDEIREARAKAYAIAYKETNRIETLIASTDAALKKCNIDLNAVEDRILELGKDTDAVAKDPKLMNEYDLLVREKERLTKQIAKEEKKRNALVPKKKENALLRQAIVKAASIEFKMIADKTSGAEQEVLFVDGEQASIKIGKVSDTLYRQACNALDFEYKKHGNRAKYLLLDGHQVEVPVVIGGLLTEAQNDRADAIITSIRTERTERENAFLAVVSEVESGKSRYDTSRDLRGTKSVSSATAERRLIADLNARFADSVRPAGLMPAEGPVHSWNFEGVSLTGIDFSGCDLSAMNFKGSTLEGCVFVGAKLNGADFGSATLVSCDFGKAKSDMVNLEDAEINLCTFHKTDLSNVPAQRAHVKGCDFYRSSVNNANFASAILEDCRFDNMQAKDMVLNNAQFESCVINASVLRGSFVDGTDFTSCIMQSCDLTGVNIGSAITAGDLSIGNIINDVPVAAEEDSTLARREEIVGEPTNGMCIIERNGQFAYADSETMQIRSGFYPNIKPFMSHHGEVVLPDGMIQWVDRNGKTILPEPVEKQFGIREGKLLVKSHSGKYNHVNLNTREYVSPIWASFADHFRDGWALIRASEEEEVAGRYGKYNYINENGDLLSPRWFITAEGFKDGKATVSFDGKESVTLLPDETIKRSDEAGNTVNNNLIDYARAVPGVPSLVFTSYYGNMRRLPKDAFIVQTSNSIPKGIEPSVVWNHAMPDYGTVSQYKEDIKAAESISDPQEKERAIRKAENRYKDAYWGKLFNETKYLAANLQRLLKDAAGRPIFLMCYEKIGDFCHRHILSEFINKNLREYITKNGGIMPPVLISEAPGSQPVMKKEESDGRDGNDINVAVKKGTSPKI